MTATPASKIVSFELNAVGFRYPTGGSIFTNVNLCLPMNSISHVTGPLGHGQSTLLKLLGFLVAPTSGSISINGLEASEMTFEEFQPWRLEIGYTFENGGLLANRTLEENLILPHLYHNLSNPDRTREEIREVAERFHFANLLDRRPALVSGGLRKLVTILRAILVRPSFLLMDDPFSGLDPDTARELEKLIFDFRAKQETGTILFTSRDETWPARLGADSVWVEDGNVNVREKKAAS